MDNEAVRVRYELVNVDDEKNDGSNSHMDETHVSGNLDPLSLSAPPNSNSLSTDVGEHDLFGEDLSSSDEDDVDIVDSAGDENLSSRAKRPASAKQELPSSMAPDVVTAFQWGMLSSNEASSAGSSSSAGATVATTSTLVEEYIDDPDFNKRKTLGEAFPNKEMDTDDDADEPDKLALLDRLSELERGIEQLQERRQAKELEIVLLDNQALKHRFHNIIDALKLEEGDKQRQHDQIMSILHQS